MPNPLSTELGRGSLQSPEEAGEAWPGPAALTTGEMLVYPRVRAVHSRRFWCTAENRPSLASLEVSVWVW